MGNGDDRGPGAGDTQPPPPSASLPASVPQRIGDYRILRQIGEGGMAIVCEAQQDEPRRRVALKLLKRSIDVQDASARLMVEREVLSMLQHDNVARIFDAGIHDVGGLQQPYFVMELIDGRSILKYCAEHAVSLADRLRLVIQACQGLHHAHSRGVIHRDISANNLLVQRGDDGPIVKVIDFGVAKTMWQPATATAPVTIAGMLPVTPEYMSPELASGDLQRVGVQSDVFSLGVLLYELLTTTLPFGGRRLRDASPAAREQILTRETPPRPSQRLAEVLAAAAGDGVRPAWTPRDLARDLDWIVGKALAVDLQVRYRSAADLAEDLRRFLAAKPVVAGPDSRWYRLRKWYRREPRYAAAVSALAFVLVVTAVFFAFGYVELQRQGENLRGLWTRSDIESNQLRASRDQVSHLQLENDVLRRDIYSNQIGRAQSLLSRGNIAGAKKELANTRAELRGWEWLHLAGMADGSTAVLGYNRAGFTALAQSSALGVVIAGSADGSVWVWDAKTNAFRYSIQHHTAAVVDLAFDEAAGLAVSLGADGMCWRWRAGQDESLGLGTGRRLCAEKDAARLLSRYENVPERVGALSADGRRVCWVGTTPVQVVDLVSGEATELRLGPDLDLRLEQTANQGLWATWVEGGPAIAFAREGKSLRPADAAMQAIESRIDDLSNGGLLFWNAALQERVDARLALTQLRPDSHLAIAGTDLGVLTREDRAYIFRAAPVAPTGVARVAAYTTLYGHEGPVGTVGISEDRGTVVTCGTDDLRLMLWRAADGAFVGDQPDYPSSRGRLAGHDAPVTRVRWGGGRFLTSSWDGSVRSWDPQSPGWVRRDAVRAAGAGGAGAEDLVLRVAYSQDGRRTIAATSSAKHDRPAALIVTDVATGISSSPIGEPKWDQVLALGPSATGDRIPAVVRAEVDDGFEDRVVTVEMPQGRVGAQPLVRHGNADCTGILWAFGGDGVLARTVRDGENWRVATWQRTQAGEWRETRSPTETMGEPSDLRFADDGLLLVACCNRALTSDAEVLCWESETGKLRWRQHLAMRGVTRGAFAHDARLVFVATRNQSLFAFDTASGDNRELPLRDTAVNALAVSPDDRRILTGSESAWARIYAVEAARGARLDLSAHLLASLPEPVGYVPDVAWSADGASLALAGGGDACVRSYRGTGELAANARILVDGLLEDRVTVAAAQAELQRQSNAQLRMALALRDDDAGRRVREIAADLFCAVADDPEYLDVVAWARLNQSDSSGSARRGGGSGPSIAKQDLNLQAQELAERAIERRPQWQYRRTLAAALLRQGQYERARAELRRADADCGDDARVGVRLLLALVDAWAAADDAARVAAARVLAERCKAAEDAAKKADDSGLDQVSTRFLGEARAWLAQREPR